MDDDWDLQAVVRSCSASTSSNSAATSSVSGSQQYFSFSSDITPDQFESSKRGNSNSVVPVQELHDLYKPFYPNLQTISAQSLPISPLSVLSGLQDLSYEQNNQPLLKQVTQQAIQQTHVKQKQPSFSVVNGSTATTTTKAHTSNSRSKRRKNNMKRVCHVAAENLSSDTWSWRKYGQKPIKGSPYPRGYYRCSTSKGCMARKQVERNRSDPAMFIVTYTAEHNHPMPTHRNSLAGSTRNKPAETTTNPDSTNKPSCSSEMSPGPSRSPGKEKLESSRDDLAEQEDDDFSISNMALDDDFFTGLEDFTKDECFSDHFPTSPQLPWVGTTSAG